MRKIKINPAVIEFGKTATNYKSRSLAAWTFWYHKPYQLDWAEAKKNLMDAQKRLHDSAQFLQGEIQTLDQHFYNRLSETLSQLDVCIQAMVNKNK